MRIYIGIAVSISMFGFILARVFWPCLRIIPWSPILVPFVLCLIVTMLLHMYGWKCWSYLCHDRKRLHSRTNASSSSIPYAYMVIGILCAWSASFGVCSWNIPSCNVPWWPALICPTVAFIYTVAVLSSKTSCSEPASSESASSSESEGSSNVNTLASGSGGDFVSGGDFAS